MKITFDFEKEDAEFLVNLLKLVSVQSNFNGIEPNWDDAPEWAKCWAVDQDGTANWLSDCNIEIQDDGWVFTDNAESDNFIKDRNVDTSKIDWKNSLRKKP